jgi:hypothetical protein
MPPGLGGDGVSPLHFHHDRQFLYLSDCAQQVPRLVSKTTPALHIFLTSDLPRCPWGKFTDPETSELGGVSSDPQLLEEVAVPNTEVTMWSLPLTHDH